MKKNKNFTIMDLVIILAIVGLIVAVLVPILVSSYNKDVHKRLMVDAEYIRAALENDGEMSYIRGVDLLFYHFTQELDEEDRKEVSNSKIVLTRAEFIDYLCEFCPSMQNALRNLQTIDENTEITITYVGTLGQETCNVSYTATIRNREVVVKRDDIVEINQVEYTFEESVQN